MNLVADENVEVQVIEHLRSNGHEVTSVAELSPALSDDQVLELARQRRAVLLTADKDFGEIVFRRRLTSYGVLFYRLAGLSNDTKAATIAAAISARGHELVGAFTLVMPGIIRVRRGEPTDAAPST